jgi:hypothetical protein
MARPAKFRGVAMEELVPGTVYFLSAEWCGLGDFEQAEKSKLSPGRTPLDAMASPPQIW